MFRASCVVYYLDQQMRNIYIHVHTHTHTHAHTHIIQTHTYKPAYRKHQHMEHTCKTVQTVYTGTKLTTSMYFNYNS